MKAQDPPRQIHSHDWTIQCVFLSRYTGVLFLSLVWTLSPGRLQNFWFAFKLIVGFPTSSAGKKPTCNVGDPGSIPGLGRSSREGVGYPLQYSWASLVVQLVKNLPTMWETCFQSLAWGDSPGEGKGYPLQYSDLEYFPNCILMVSKSQTWTERLSLLTSLYSYSPLLFLTIASKIMFSYLFSQASWGDQDILVTARPWTDVSTTTETPFPCGQRVSTATPRAPPLLLKEKKKGKHCCLVFHLFDFSWSFCSIFVASFNRTRYRYFIFTWSLRIQREV